MKKTYFHGTTRENALRILAGEKKITATWVCSDDDFLYLWSPDALCDGDQIEYDEDYAIRRAFESAQITAASSDSPQKEIVVLQFEFSDKQVEEDFSCENMAGASCVREKNYKKYLKAVFTHPHNSRLDAFILSGLINHPLLNTENLDEELVSICETLHSTDLPYMESLSDFNWEKANISDFLSNLA